MVPTRVIEDELGTLAHVYDLSAAASTSFPTPPEFPLQFGVHVNPQARSYRPHVHKPISRAGHATAEFIFVQKGKLEVGFLNEEGAPLGWIELTPNQALLQIRGGHAIRSADDTVFFELKLGPYLGPDADKTFVSESEGASG